MQNLEQFLQYVIEPHGLALCMGFYSGDDFANYIQKNGEEVFSNGETKALNEMTSKGFDISEKQNADIYALSMI